MEQDRATYGHTKVRFGTRTTKTAVSVIYNDIYDTSIIGIMVIYILINI